MSKELQQNIQGMINMLNEIDTDMKRSEHAPDEDKLLLNKSIQSLQKSMKIVNSALPQLIRSTSNHKLPKPPSLNEAPPSDNSQQASKTSIPRIDSKMALTLDRSDRQRLKKELRINDTLLRRLRKRESIKKEKPEEFKAARGYLKTSNKYFLSRANTITKQGYFKELSTEIRKANIDMLFESYVAMMIFTTLIFFGVGILLWIIFLFVTFTTTPPFITFVQEGFLLRFIKLIWIPIVVPAIAFFFVYIYPSTEKGSLKKKIDQEIPFAVIHMSAISGSGIAPSEIFRIIGLSKEYKYLRREIRKVLNQINLYGYDLVTALNNASKSVPSERLSELFSGLSTTITSGANLPEYFSKRAETLLLNYRLERERYTKVAETFLDIYISIVIAAPMIFLLLIVMMGITGFQLGLTTSQLAFLSVAAVALLNVLFLVFLNLKQPTY